MRLRLGRRLVNLLPLALRTKTLTVPRNSAPREEKDFMSSGSSKTRLKYSPTHPSFVVYAHADFPKPPKTVFDLVPNVSPVGKHRGTVSGATNRA